MQQSTRYEFSLGQDDSSIFPYIASEFWNNFSSIMNIAAVKLISILNGGSSFYIRGNMYWIILVNSSDSYINHWLSLILCFVV